MDTTTLTRILEENPHDGMLVYKRLAAAVGERLVNAYKAVLSGQEQEQSGLVRFTPGLSSRGDVVFPCLVANGRTHLLIAREPVR